MNVVSLVGSPRNENSASFVLSSYLAERLQPSQEKRVTHFLHRAVRRAPALADLLDDVKEADFLLFASPLYVDSLPAPVVKALEILANHLKDASGLSEIRVVAISNCGFPEPEQNVLALEMYRLFAERVGMAWAAGIPVGAGEALKKGAPLSESPGFAQEFMEVLDQIAEALRSGRPVTPTLLSRLQKPFMPGGMYRLMGGTGWRIRAAQEGVFTNLRARPWSQEEH